jgi:recombination protein RecA
MKTISRGEEPVGVHAKVKIVKNKVGPPLRVAEIDIMFNEGISREIELLQLGEKYGVIEHTGAGYSYGDHKLGRGLEASRVFLRGEPGLAAEIRREVLQKMKEGVDNDLGESTVKRDNGVVQDAVGQYRG